MDPKEHEELKAAHAKLEQSLAESERAQGTLEKGKAELLRAKTALEKEKNDSTTQNVKMQSMVSNERAGTVLVYNPWRDCCSRTC